MAAFKLGSTMGMARAQPEGDNSRNLKDSTMAVLELVPTKERSIDAP